MSRDILQEQFMNEVLGVELNSHVRRSEQARKDAEDFAADLKRVPKHPETFKVGLCAALPSL
jgi:hypothetical protein